MRALPFPIDASDDLLDAVKWAVDQKIADAHKVAIVGGSYGDYSTLVCLERLGAPHPERACVAIAADGG